MNANKRECSYLKKNYKCFYLRLFALFTTRFPALRPTGCTYVHSKCSRHFSADKLFFLLHKKRAIQPFSYRNKYPGISFCFYQQFCWLLSMASSRVSLHPLLRFDVHGLFCAALQDFSLRNAFLQDILWQTDHFEFQ